jgi:hypothetical protein
VCGEVRRERLGQVEAGEPEADTGVGREHPSRAPGGERERLVDGAGGERRVAAA